MNREAERRCRKEYELVRRTLERRKVHGAHPHPLPTFAAFRVAWLAKEARARVPEDAA